MKLTRDILKDTKINCNGCGKFIGTFNKDVSPETMADPSQVDFAPGVEFKNGDEFKCKACEQDTGIPEYKRGSFLFTWPDEHQLVFWGRG